MKTNHPILILALGFCVFTLQSFAGGELAVNTAAPVLYDFPVERVHAAVDLYREGGGQEQIAVAAISKLGPAARTELLAMKHTANSNAEAAAITEILDVCPVQSQEPAIAAPEKSAPRARIITHRTTHTRSKPAATAPAKSAAPENPTATPKKKSPQRIVISVTGMTNPLMPWATRF